MTYELTDQEKANNLINRIKGLKGNQYLYSMAIIEQNALTSPNSDIIAEANSKINDLDKQINALIAELDKLDYQTSSSIPDAPPAPTL